MRYGTLSYSQSNGKTVANVFGLLSISMIPTIIGAALATPLVPVFAAHPIMFLISYLVATFGLYFAIAANADNPLGVVLTLVFTGINGIALAPTLSYYAGAYVNGTALIVEAASLTFMALFAAYAYSALFKKNLSFMGSFLFVGLMMFIGVSIIGIFVHGTLFSLVLSALGAGLFTMYLFYDVNQVVMNGETNYVLATIQIYLDLLNLFVNLLRLLSILQNDD